VPPTVPPGNPREPPRGKGGHGCLVAGAALAGALALAVAGGTFILHEARVQREIVQRGTTAPGIEDLRAIGCDPGTTVMDAHELRGMLDSGLPADTSVFVACLATEGGAVPTCDDVARTYARAAHPSGSFVAEVRVVKRFRIECRRVYGADGG